MNTLLFPTHTQPLVSQLTDSNAKVIALDKEVTRLQELADELYREKNSLKENDPTTVHSEDNPTSVKLDNLIDLNSPEDSDKTLCAAPSEQVMATSIYVSLSESLLLEPTLTVSTEVLQPIIVDEDKVEIDSNSIPHEPSFIEQSQELF